MAWEKETKAVERHLEVVSALQREFVRALFRVAEEYDQDPVELAQTAGNMTHSLLQPLFRIQQERMLRQQQEAMRQQKSSPEKP